MATTISGLTGSDLRAKHDAELESSGLTCAEIAAVKVAQGNAARNLMRLHTSLRQSAGHAAARIFVRQVLELLEAVARCQCPACSKDGRPS